MSDPIQGPWIDPIAECLTEAELALDARDHCRVDLAACTDRLAVRTPTVAATLVVREPCPAPEPAFGLPLVVSLIVAGAALGLVSGLAWGVTLD